MRFVVRALLIAILHAAITVAFVFAWTRISDADNQRTWPAFGWSAGAVTFSSPLYQVPKARQQLSFLYGTAINSALCGVVLAIVFWRARRLWFLLLVPALWFGMLTGAAVILERRVDNASGRIPITTRFPHQNANASSRRVDQFLGAIEDENFSRTRGALLKYLAAEFARADDRIEPLPVDVENFIVRHRFDLDALEGTLLSNEPPQWEIDLTASDQPDWLRYFWLQKLVVADALVSARANDFDRARQRLEAARRLMVSFAARPEPIAVMTAISSAENQLGAARKLGVNLPRFDPREHLIGALEAESWTERFLVATSRFDSNWNDRNVLARAMLTVFVRPYARLCAAKAAFDQLANIRIVRDLGRCVFQTPKYPNEYKPGIINPLDVLNAPSTAGRAVRSNRLLLDFEGTEVINRARGAPAILPASFCPDHKWMHDRGVVHLEPAVPAPYAALPTRHTISPAARKPPSETLPASATSQSFPK